MDLKETYNRIAEDWYKDHHGDDWWVKGTDKFISLLKPHATVLDVGCGAGVKSKYLLDRGLKVIGVDFSDKMIEIAKREVPKGEFYVKDIYDLKDFNKTFDGVFAQAVLLHIPKARIGEAMDNLASRLNEGGYLYVAVKQSRPGEKDEKIEMENDYGYSYERFFSYFTLDEIKGLFEAAGLAVQYENVALYGRTNWIQVIGVKH